MQRCEKFTTLVTKFATCHHLYNASPLYYVFIGGVEKLECLLRHIREGSMDETRQLQGGIVFAIHVTWAHRGVGRVGAAGHCRLLDADLDTPGLVLKVVYSRGPTPAFRIA